MPYLIAFTGSLVAIASIQLGSVVGFFWLLLVAFFVSELFFLKSAVKFLLRIFIFGGVLTFLAAGIFGSRSVTVGDSCQSTVIRMYDRAVGVRTDSCGISRGSGGLVYVYCSGRCPDLYQLGKILITKSSGFGRYSAVGTQVGGNYWDKNAAIYYVWLRWGSGQRYEYYQWLATKIPSENAALVSSMLFGEVELPTELKDKMKMLGVLHVIAISGINIVYLQVLLRMLTKKLPRKWRDLAEFSVIFVLFLIVGESVSLMRAIGMMLVKFVVRLTGLAWKKWMYLIAFLLLLLVDFRFFYDVGYWLVFSACFGVYIAAIQVRKYVKWGVFDDFLVGIVVWVCVAPVQWLFFQEVYPIGVVVGIVLAPLVELVTVVGYVSSIVRFSGIFESAISWTLGVFSVLILLVINMFHVLR